MAGRWADRAFLRGRQYRTDANLSARQAIYACQHPRLDLPAEVLDLVPPPSGLVLDVGCGNGRYLAELARRGTARALGVDLSPGMLTAARQRVAAVGDPGPAAAGDPGPAAADDSGPAAVGGPGPAAVGGPGPAAAGDPAATFPRSPPSVALACADATALPLPDEAAELVLAPHMLYHLPDPAQALRELRRVTRPGGQVLVVLNGAGHLAQLRAAAAAVGGGDLAALGERVTLDDGEALARPVFAAVTRHDFTAELRVPEPAVIADYVRSMAGAGLGGADPDEVAAAIPKTRDGHYLITSHSGCLVCRVA